MEIEDVLMRLVHVSAMCSAILDIFVVMERYGEEGNLVGWAAAKEQIESIHLAIECEYFNLPSLLRTELMRILLTIDWLLPSHDDQGEQVCFSLYLLSFISLQNFYAEG